MTSRARDKNTRATMIIVVACVWEAARGGFWLLLYIGVAKIDVFSMRKNIW